MLFFCCLGYSFILFCFHFLYPYSHEASSPKEVPSIGLTYTAYLNFILFIFSHEASSPEELPSLGLTYTAYLGGVPEDLDDLPSADKMVAARSPYIGCIRDVLTPNSVGVEDFNAAQRVTAGIEKGQCREEILPDMGEIH